MADSVYWVWLQQALGIGSIQVDRALQTFDSPEVLFHTPLRGLVESGLFTQKQAERICNLSIDAAKRQVEQAEKFGCKIITPEHPDYPQNLTNIDGIPCVLYVKGDLSGLDETLVLTMVGTRKANAYGESASRKLSYDLALAGCVIASGLATGIDTASHEGVLAANGRSIGVLACGIDINYPAKSRALKEQILANGGAIISEFPLGEQAFRSNFYIRNRILSGISAGVIVAQAPEHSGALITARHALEQNREVFAVPGDIFDENMVGCNLLIKQGAKIILNVYSILEEYIGRFPDAMQPEQILRKIGRPTVGSKVKTVKKKELSNAKEEPPLMVAQQPAELIERRLGVEQLKALGLTQTAQEIYLLLEESPSPVDLIAQKSERSITQVMAGLIELELQGLARQMPGKQYVINTSGNG